MLYYTVVYSKAVGIPFPDTVPVILLISKTALSFYDHFLINSRDSVKAHHSLCRSYAISHSYHFAGSTGFSLSYAYPSVSYYLPDSS